MTMAIDAYHGTSLQSAEEIQKTSFKESDSEYDWLGRGIYFFVDGISDPLSDAIAWAESQAWDKQERRLRYTEVSVLKATVELDENRLIDLTSQDGLKTFNLIKTKLLNRIFKDFTTANLIDMNGAQHNCAMFNYIVATLKAHAVKHNLYIKNKSERKLHLKLNVPNSTVLCVRKANFKGDIKREYDGRI